MTESNNKQETKQSSTQEQRNNYEDANETMKLCETLKNEVKKLPAENQKNCKMTSKK